MTTSARRSTRSVPAASAPEAPRLVQPLLDAAPRAEDLKAALVAAIQKLGFRWFGFVRFARGPDGLGDVLGNWGNSPVEWQNTQRAQGYGRIDPRYREALHTSLPACWDAAKFSTEPGLDEFFASAASFDIRSGACLAIYQPNPHHVDFLAVCGPEARLDGNWGRHVAASLGSLWVLATYGHRLLPAGALAPVARKARLSPRAVECLALAAQGGTSAMIATRIGISERTVNAHLDLARRRLGARNRHEAVAQGLIRGLISV